MNTDLTITQLITHYLDNRDIAETSKRVYSYVIRYFYQWLTIQGTRIDQLATSDVIAYKTFLKNNNKRPQTIDLYINALRGFYRWLADRGIYTNITTNIRAEKKSKSFSREPLSIEQVNQFINSIPVNSLINLRDRAIIMLLYFNGLRVIEVSRIRMQDIDLEKQRIYIQGKGMNERQPVQINNEVINAIENYIHSKAESLPGYEFQETDPLFTSCSRHCISLDKIKLLPSKEISHMVSNRMEATGIKTRTITAHSLRHSSAVHMIDGGFTLHDVQLFLRHSDANTSRIYIRYSEEKKAQRNEVTMFLQSKFQEGRTQEKEIKK